MEVFIAIGAAHSLYIATLLFIKQNSGKADKILSLFFIILTISYTLGYLSYYLNTDGLRIFLWNIGMLLPQIIYLYIKQLFNSNSRFRKINILHFLPWVLSSLYIVFLGYTHTSKEMVVILNNNNYLSKPLLYIFFCIVDLSLSPIYGFFIIRSIREYRKKVKANYSFTEDINLDWVKNVTITAIGIWLVIYTLYIISSFHYLTEDDSIKYGFALSIIFVFYIGYYGLKQKNIFFISDSETTTQTSAQNADNEKTDLPKVKYQKTGLTDDKAKILMNDINSYMQNQKPYLNQQLSIQQLSEIAQIPSHHISQTLNTISGQSFYSYVNTYRINAFIEKIENKEHLKNTLIGLAYDCGFNSKSSFNRIFKEIKGVSPSEYIKSVN